METKYAHQTNELDTNRCDIFEIGGEVVAYGVSWELTEKIVDFLNNMETE